MVNKLRPIHLKCNCEPPGINRAVRLVYPRRRFFFGVRDRSVRQVCNLSVPHFFEGLPGDSPPSRFNAG